MTIYQRASNEKAKLCTGGWLWLLFFCSFLPSFAQTLTPVLEATAVLQFLPARSFATGPSPQWFATTDFNRDGRRNLAVVNANSDTLLLLVGDGAGGFAAPTSIVLSHGFGAVLAADFNDRGKPDLAVVNFGCGYVSVFLGKGDQERRTAP